jgi:hypothetical protein
MVCGQTAPRVAAERRERRVHLTMTISEHEKANARRPACRGTKVTPQLGGFKGQTTKKS